MRQWRAAGLIINTMIVIIVVLIVAVQESAARVNDIAAAADETVAAVIYLRNGAMGTKSCIQQCGNYCEYAETVLLRSRNVWSVS